MMRVNLMGAVNCVRAAVPYMRARGGRRIVNQVSRGAFLPKGIYRITKRALVGATVATAKSLGKDKIAVNAIAQGNVASEAGKALAETYTEAFQTFQQQMTALRVEGQLDELVGALMLLVPDAGSWMTGQVLHVDGGVVLRP